MTDGFMSDIVALQALVPILRERADADAADFALGNNPDVGRSTNEADAALQVLDGTIKQATTDVTGIADAGRRPGSGQGGPTGS